MTVQKQWLSQEYKLGRKNKFRVEVLIIRKETQR